MGFLLWFLKAALKIAKPFLKQALIESILETLDELVNGEPAAETTTGEETTAAE